MKYRLFLFVLMLFSGCVERFQFETEGTPEGLVVEGFISNVSFNDSRRSAAEPRYFTVKLSRPGVVTNQYDPPVRGATVELVTDTGLRFQYTETPVAYVLFRPDFKTEPGVQYKLAITLADGKTFETAYQAPPEPIPAGPITFAEVVRDELVSVNGDKVLQKIRGIDVSINLPITSVERFYRWEFESAWIFIAPGAPVNSSVRTCWIQNKSYIDFFTLHSDKKGGYKQKLFFLKTTANERMMNEFTVYIRQFSMSEETYAFWEDVDEQLQRGGLFDPPPYNVRTNIIPVNNEDPVFGYFQVLGESSRRWYLKKEDLRFFEPLTISCGGPPPPFDADFCRNCMANPLGTPTNTKPFWWR